MIQHIFKVHKLGIIQLPIFGKSKKQHGTPKHMEVWFGSDDFPEFSTEDKENEFLQISNMEVQYRRQRIKMIFPDFKC